MAELDSVDVAEDERTVILTRDGYRLSIRRLGDSVELCTANACVELELTAKETIALMELFESFGQETGPVQEVQSDAE